MSNIKTFNYLLQLGAHIGSGIYEYNYSSALNNYLLGSRNNYYIFDLKKTVFFLKKALFYISKLGTFKQHLLFFYSDFTNYN